MKNISLEKAINEFPNYLSLKGKTITTKTAYMADIKIFQNFVNINSPKVKNTNDITKSHIVFYQNHLLELVENGKYKKTTCDRKFDSLKVFFNYLEEYKHINDNPLKGFTFSRIKGKFSPGFKTSSLPNYLEISEIREIIDYAKSLKESNTLRDIAILEMLYSTGCRRSTILELEWSDINLYEKKVLLKHEKTKNETNIPMSASFYEAINNYAISLKALTGKVFPISKRCFSNTIKKYAIESKVQNRKSFEITSKTFRHSFITDLVKKDIPLEKIVRFTGHTDLNTLKIYTHLKTEDLSYITDML